jgi:FixJ family two-component response regulator
VGVPKWATPQSHFETLSARQKEVAALVAEGLSKHEIASRLEEIARAAMEEQQVIIEINRLRAVEGQIMQVR